MPAAAVASFTPAIGGSFGNDFGARGETGTGAATATTFEFVSPGLCRASTSFFQTREI
jgi:hypothetical protein